MALLELGQRKYSIPVGEVVLGSDAGCAISLTGAGVLPRHALLLSQADGQVVIRKAAPAAEVTINGVRLGSEPTPLLHGDKVEVGDHELTFVDERRSGSTQYVQALPQAMAQGKGGGAAAKPGATGNTGGRIVSLTDGREYVIAGPSLVFGREAGCDVVVSGKDVSRRHAEIVQTPRGYLLVDSSTNGTFVNETRVEGQRILQRADVIRIGDEQFRFYADVVPAPPAPSAPAGPPPGPAVSAPQAAPQAPPGASERLRDTMHGLEPVPRPSQAGSLASFLVKSGTLKGQRLQVRTPVANVGRADYNDLVLPTAPSPLPREAAASRGRLGARGPRLHEWHLRGRRAGARREPARARCRGALWRRPARVRADRRRCGSREGRRYAGAQDASLGAARCQADPLQAGPVQAPARGEGCPRCPRCARCPRPRRSCAARGEAGRQAAANRAATREKG